MYRSCLDFLVMTGTCEITGWTLLWFLSPLLSLWEIMFGLVVTEVTESLLLLPVKKMKNHHTISPLNRIQYRFRKTKSYDKNLFYLRHTSIVNGTWMSLVNAPWIQRARKLKNMTPREISNFQTIFKTIQNRFEKQLAERKLKS